MLETLACLKIESDITKVSPGHGLSPQEFVSVLFPCMQSPSSLMQSLFLLCTPPPQVSEQELQLPHIDQSVSGGSTEKDWLRKIPFTWTWIGSTGANVPASARAEFDLERKKEDRERKV